MTSRTAARPAAAMGRAKVRGGDKCCNEPCSYHAGTPPPTRGTDRVRVSRAKACSYRADQEPLFFTCREQAVQLQLQPQQRSALPPTRARTSVTFLSATGACAGSGVVKLGRDIK
jgi:hypothetical protein